MPLERLRAGLPSAPRSTPRFAPGSRPGSGSRASRRTERPGRPRPSEPPGRPLQSVRRLPRTVLAILHLLLPDPCLGCGRRLDGGEDLGLCLGCRGGLRAHRPGCGRCGAPLPGDRVLPPGVACGPCRRSPPSFAALLSPWRYEPPLVAVVHALKFAGCGHLGRRIAAPLARWLLTTQGAGTAGSARDSRRRVLSDLDAGLGPADPGGPRRRPGPDLVVPVPLHPVRRWRRGYNQAERIGRPLAHHLGLPFASPLTRHRATGTQARLPRERRRENVAAAFRVGRRGAARVRGRNLLLVDDVCTTGATLEAAARALRQAGARRVLAVTAARTPPPAAGEAETG